MNLAALSRINTTFNLAVLPTGPTRFTETTSTTIDLLITDSPSSVLKSKTYTGNTISDHDMVYLLANVRIPRSAPQTMRVRNLHAIDPVQLQADFQVRDLTSFLAAEDTSTKADLLTGVLTDLLQIHAPERTIAVRDKRTPWISEPIKQAVALRDLAFALYSRNPNRTRGDIQWHQEARPCQLPHICSQKTLC